jgi:FKBP-type peptidyl-prolyl cis-trans isomerase
MQKSNVRTFVTSTIVGVLLGVNLLAGAHVAFAAEDASSAGQVTTQPAVPAPAPKPKKKAKGVKMQPQITEIPGLKIHDEKVGDGIIAQNGKKVRVNYTGTLTTGVQFDSSIGNSRQPFEFQLGAGQVIQGWDKGIVGMKVGGKRKLTIEPQLAYGSRGAGAVIPPNATLLFDVELLGVE